MQNGQTEPAGASPEGVRVYAERFGLFVVKNIKNKGTRNYEFLLLINNTNLFVFDGLR